MATVEKSTQTVPEIKQADPKDKLSDEERYALWGLGRGINITKPTPWLDKTAFQVRVVIKDDIIETDDGGLLKAYSEELRSRSSVSTEVNAGIKAPNAPLSIGVDAEYTRSDLCSTYVVGTKVKNRTISFRLDFADVPRTRVKNIKDAKKKILKAKQSVATDTSESTEQKGVAVSGGDFGRSASGEDFGNSVSGGDIDNGTAGSGAGESGKPDGKDKGKVDESFFEQRLCKWLIDCLNLREYHLQTNEKLYDLIRRKCENENDDILEIEEDLEHFVEHFGVTHYVSAIVLGGLDYEELTGKEFVKQAGGGGNVSVDTGAYGAVGVSAKATKTSSSSSSTSSRKQIGKITNNKVVRDDEAVIGCEIRPISTLVKNPYLQQALTSAVTKYTQKKSKHGGPYLIMCGKDMYITVDEEKKHLAVTSSKDDAIAIMVKVLGDCSSHHRFEFSLTSTLEKHKDLKSASRKGKEEAEVKAKASDDQQQSQATALANSTVTTQETPSSASEYKLTPLEYYLETVVSPVLGKGNDPPRMRMNSNTKNIRMLLKKRIDHKIACDTKQWRKGREAYYIQCIHPYRNGYLCVKRVKQRSHAGTDTVTYKVCVKPSVDFHSDDSEVFMLFRLLPI